MKFNKKTVCKTFASLFGIGFLPLMPGTLGSAIVVAVFIIPEYNRIYFLLIILLALLITSILTLPHLYNKNDSDPSYIVIDEAIGMVIVFLTPFIYFDIIWISIAFILFRFFDIVKPYPISFLDKKAGVFFIIADDIAAALISTIILHILYAGYRSLPFVVLYLKNSNIIN